MGGRKGQQCRDVQLYLGPCRGGDHDRLPEGSGRTEVRPDSRSEVTGEIN